MEPVTHFLTGACIGRAGLNRKTAYATLAAVLAAEAADIDVLWGLAGPVEALKHHRGITHTLIAVPVVAAAAVGMVWLFDRWRRTRRNRRLGTEVLKGHGFSRAIEGPNEDAAIAVEGMQSDKNRFPQGLKPKILLAQLTARLKPRPFKASAPNARQEVHWGWLYLTAFLSALCHLLLDWTNNYGLRPFFPFNPRWYAGSFVFIAEPVLWALLLGALVIPGLLGLIGGEIGVRRAAFRGRGWAIFALTGMVLLWGWRWAEQGRARALAENTAIAMAPVKRMALEPYPINLFRWHAILETAEYYQTAEINTLSGEIVSDPRRDVLYKPLATPATEAAKRTLLGQVYLDWSTWAVVRDVGQEAAPGMKPPQLPPNRTWTTVEFTDLRFAYSYLGTGRTPIRNPLSGWVYIVDGRDEAGEAMNGREQR
jgi:inner membrane protein